MMCVCVSIEMSPYQKVSSCVALTVMLHLLHSTAHIVTLEILGIPLGLLAGGCQPVPRIVQGWKTTTCFLNLFETCWNHKATLPVDGSSQSRHQFLPVHRCPSVAPRVFWRSSRPENDGVSRSQMPSGGGFGLSISWSKGNFIMVFTRCSSSFPPWPKIGHPPWHPDVLHARCQLQSRPEKAMGLLQLVTRWHVSHVRCGCKEESPRETETFLGRPRTSMIKPPLYGRQCNIKGQNEGGLWEPARVWEFPAKVGTCFNFPAVQRRLRGVERGLTGHDWTVSEVPRPRRSEENFCSICCIFFWTWRPQDQQSTSCHWAING